MTTDPVATVVREGQAFLDRLDLPKNKALPARQVEAATFGAWAWGCLRALYECDNCPGSYRVPLGKLAAERFGVECNSDEDILKCPACGAEFLHVDAHPSIRQLYEAKT